MNTSEESTTRRRRKPSRNKNFSFVVVFLLIFAASIALSFYIFNTVSPSPGDTHTNTQHNTSSPIQNDGNTPTEAPILSQTLTGSSPIEKPSSISESSGNNRQQAASDKKTYNGPQTASPGDFSGPLTNSPPTALPQTNQVENTQHADDSSPIHLVSQLNTFYSQLDSRPYMRDFALQESSKLHFSKLIQKLLDHPPVVTRETDDLFTLLKNTAHFFRILGKKNVLLLKGILDREHDSLESIMKTLFELSFYPDIVQREYGITLHQDPLLDYCGFFLSTMGGRLYLFRRDSTSRMLVTYYTILLLDQAQQNGNNRLGIDLRPPISSLIEELENGGQNLKMHDQYLDTLYTLEENYEARTR